MNNGASIVTRIRARRPLAATVAAAAAIAAVMATPAFGVQQRIVALFRASGGPPATTIDAAHAVKLQSTSDANGDTIELWRAPNQSGGQCIFLHQAGPTTAPSPFGSGGGVCSVGPPVPQTVPIRAFVNWRADGDQATVVVGGHIADTSGIEQIRLMSQGRATLLQLTDGYFLTALPEAPAVGKLPAGGPYEFVGLNQSGREVATLDLAELLSHAQP